MQRHCQWDQQSGSLPDTRSFEMPRYTRFPGGTAQIAEIVPENKLLEGDRVVRFMRLGGTEPRRK